MKNIHILPEDLTQLTDRMHKYNLILADLEAFLENESALYTSEPATAANAITLAAVEG